MLKEIQQTDEYNSGAYGSALKVGALKMDSKMEKMFEDKERTPGSTANMSLEENCMQVIQVTADVFAALMENHWP